MTGPKPTSSKTSTTSWIVGFLAMLAAFFGGRATTPSSPPPGPTKDTTVVVAPPPKDTTVVKVPPSTDTTVIVVPPVATPPSSGAYVTLLADSVRYTSTAQLVARVSQNVRGTCSSNCLYSDGPNAGMATLDQTILYHGHPTIQYGQAAGSGLIPEMWVGIPGGSKHLWVKEAIRFSPGWSTKGTGSGSNAYKMFGFGYLGSDGSGRLEITNTTQYQLYWGVGTIAPETFDLTVGQIASEWTDGNFYTYIYDIDFSAGNSGTVRLWIAKDGESPTLRGTVTIPTTGTLPPLGAINFGMNFNQAQRSGMPAQQINYGGWEIVDAAKYPHPFGV